jgi:hypothetical protein
MFGLIAGQPLNISQNKMRHRFAPANLKMVIKGEHIICFVLKLVSQIQTVERWCPRKRGKQNSANLMFLLYLLDEHNGR